MFINLNIYSKQTHKSYRNRMQYRGKSPINDALLIPTPSRILVTIRDIQKLYIHELLVI